MEEASPRRLVMELRDGAEFRLARGRPWELSPIEQALREEGIPLARP